MTSNAHRSRRLRFGLHTASPRGSAFLAFARSVQEAGVDVLTVPDHFAPALSPFAAASAAAAATTTLHTGTLVLNNDFRHPVDTAREAATIADLSGGRFELGIGAGHMKSEYDAAGIAFDRGGVRVNRLGEAVALIRSLLRGDAVAVDGTHYRVHAGAGDLLAAPSSPVPLLIGGNGTRVLGLAGRFADIAGLAGISHNQDASAVRLSHVDPDGVADRIAVVRDAAGDRFAEIELNGLIQFVVHTEDRASAAADVAASFGVAPEVLLQSPFALFGTHEQMADALLDRQRRFGISYWTVFDGFGDRPSALPHLTEVIALLRS